MQKHILEAIRSSVMLNELYEAVGYDALLALLEEWGGRRVYVPQSYGSESHPLVQKIGREAAESLSWRYAGENLNVPTAMIIKNAQRNHEMVQKRLKHGKTVCALSREYNLSERQIRSILDQQEIPCRENPLPRSRPRRTPRERSDTRRGQLELFQKV